MPFAKHVIAAKGKVLTLVCDFGFGWLEYDLQRQSRRIEVPTPFDFLAEEFWEVQGQIVAVVGPVTQAGHFLHGFALCALPVPYVEIDFEKNQGNYHLLLTPKGARLTGTHPPPHYDSVVGLSYPEYRGYAGSIRLKGTGGDEPE